MALKKTKAIAPKAAAVQSIRIVAREPAAKENTRFEVRAKGDVTEIDLYEEIGFFGVTAKSFKTALDSISTPRIVLNINSPGGVVFDGVAMYNDLIAHSAKVEVHVKGVAASAASIVAMAGDEIVMGAGSFLMIHNSSTITLGDTRELARISRVLSQIDKAMATTYADKTGIDVEEIAQMMNDETWIDAASAVDQGFADRVENTADSSAKARFDLSAFANAPQSIAERKPEPKAAKLDVSELHAALDRALAAFKC